MKKLIALFFITCFFSCKDENLNDVNLIGKWSLQKKELIKGNDGQIQTFLSSDCQIKSIYEFQQTHQKLTIYNFVNDTCKQINVLERKYTFDQTNMKFWYFDEKDAPWYITKLNLTQLVCEDRDHNYDSDIRLDTLIEYYNRIY